MHRSILERFAAGFVARHEIEGAEVLEVGSQNVNGTVRPLFSLARRYVGIDMAPGRGVDEVVDSERLAERFGADAFDIVLSTEMLEHVVDWKACLRQMALVLRPGGLLVLTTRSPGFIYHPFPIDCWRFPPGLMAEIISAMGFMVMVCEPDDPLFPGVLVKARKPADWTLAHFDLTGIGAVPVVKESDMTNRTFEVKPEHGRVFAWDENGHGTLVAVPGDTIPYALAVKCGLVPPPAKDEVTITHDQNFRLPQVEPDEKPKAKPRKSAAKKSGTASYPSKPDRK